MRNKVVLLPRSPSSPRGKVLLSPCPAADDHFSHLEIHARLAVKKFRVSIRLVQTKFKHSTNSKSSRYQNRELAQKPHELHAALGHWAKPCAEIKFDVTKDKYWWVKKSHWCLNCCVQDTKSVGSLSRAGVMAGKTAPPGCASTRYPFG
jgi:hypothetical protein